MKTFVFTDPVANVLKVELIAEDEQEKSLLREYWREKNDTIVISCEQWREEVANASGL